MMGDIFASIEKLARGFQDSLSVRTVYGEPISANGVTIVPVAEVVFGFGGGGGGGTGTGPSAGPESALQGGSGGGGGGGGGGVVDPVGYVEITDGGSRWVPLEQAQSELILQAIRSAARILPFAGRRGIFAVLALLAAQALIGQLLRAQMPSVADLIGAGTRAAGRA
jgi:uncharacterized spore protein YtfJ